MPSGPKIYEYIVHIMKGCIFLYLLIYERQEIRNLYLIFSLLFFER